MADYVHKNILSEAYVHIEMVELSPGQKIEFENALLGFAESRGRFAIYEEITPEIRTADGSLKVYSSITGTLSEALGDFPTFDEALDSLYTDAKRLAEAMILEALFIVKARGRSVLRREARTGIIRSTKELFDGIQLARASYESDSGRSAIRRLQEIRKRLENLFHVFSSQADRDLVGREALSKIVKLPTPLKLREHEVSTYRTEIAVIKKVISRASSEDEL